MVHAHRTDTELKAVLERHHAYINTIEGFWSYVKGGLKSYKAVSPKYLPFYLVQYEWQYNHRNYKGNQFEAFLTNALQREKELEYWGAESAEDVKEIAYS